MVQTLRQKALKKLPPKASQLHKKIIEMLAGHISQDDAHLFDSELFQDVCRTHLAMAQNRKDRSSQFRIYCPLTANPKHRKTIIDVVHDDMAFLVDSIVAEINKNNFLIDLLVQTIIFAKYDANGRLKDLSLTEKDGYTRQSHVHIHIKDTLSEQSMARLEDGLNEALADVFVANRDWKKMLDKLKSARDELAHAKTKRPVMEIQEYCAFLDYLYNNNFTLLGYREYEFAETKDGLKSRTVKGQSLGLLSDDIKPAFVSESHEGLPRNLQELRRALPPVSVSKTNRLSTVHRLVPMDAIAIKVYDGKGQVVGEKLFLGLLTSVTYSRSVSDIPYLRQRVEEVMTLSRFTVGSHDYKALRHILEKYPRDELFQITKEELFDICLNILRLQERQRISLFLRHDRFGRYISCLVYVPRERFGTNIRKAIGKILERELNGTLANFYTSMDDSLFARAMFIINVSQKDPPKYNVKAIEEKLREAGQTWQERLNGAFSEVMDNQAEIARMTLKYGEAFTNAYTDRYTPKQALFDIEKIEECMTSGKIAINLYKPADIGEKELRLKLYNLGRPFNLSDIMPILEDMGLWAITELPFQVKPADAGQSVWIQDLLLRSDMLNGYRIEEVRENFENAFQDVWYGRLENDSLNKLILGAKLTGREITIIRSYVRYLRQIQFPFSRSYMHQALNNNPKIARTLVELFDALLDPKKQGNAEQLAGNISSAIDYQLEKVESLDYDRILRNIRALIMATLRTNYYQRDAQGLPKTYLSHKLDCSQIPDLPEPRPYRETFVYSPRVEAIHLRGDKIARGGIRWSDRHEDFRTEVLGLMKAQMVKNAVIVPMGAKGGFVVKSKIADRDAYKKEGVECYRTLIRGLLDLADNMKGARVIPPRNVVRRDGDDPYLVVAADKGTATFSDIANAISVEEYDFWLGDAFASGGSAGYDHKKMGITARGAWECIKLHFRQLNHNTQTQPFDVVGIGDMGGDVFGNGMLMSDKICLIGAFNHLHIFCDPEPDPAVSFKERQRLFKDISGWDAYNTKLLSKGGRIYSRNDKILTLTPEIQNRFDIGKEKVMPFELIRAMLKARTDLLFFGGIGTYIKASAQSDTDVGDKANDALRVDANVVRAKVIGEGANLAITQLARVEFAESGGKINTDFLDNSAGVDSSDHEVNIKILLSDIMRRKGNTMTRGARNKLLESMTNDVAQHVLRNNYQQSQAISLIELRARERLQLQEALIMDLEREQGLNRALEGLPDHEDIQNRLRLGRGLTRPEICVVFAYAKIAFSRNLLASDIPDRPDMQDWLISYFPAALQKKYLKEILQHRLRREIIATLISNSLINRMGAGFMLEQRKKTGASEADSAMAYIIVRDIFKLRELWDSIEALDNKVPAQVQLKAMKDITELAKHASTWFLRRGALKDMDKDMKEYRAGIAALSKSLPSLVSSDLKEGIVQRTAIGVQDGLPEPLAHKIASMPVLSSACDIIRISLDSKCDLAQTARAYFEIGQYFHLEWLRQQARFLTSDDPWHSEATSGIIDQLYSSQAGLTTRMLKETDRKLLKEKHITHVWFRDNAAQLRQVDQFLGDLRRAGTVDLPMLIIAEQRLRNLCG